MIREEDTMSISTIPEYLFYNGFNQDISVASVYERIQDSQHDYPIRDHAILSLLSYMVGSCINTDTKPFAPHRELYKMIPPQARMWAQRRFEQILLTLVPAAKKGLSQTVTH